MIQINITKETRRAAKIVALRYGFKSINEAYSWMIDNKASEILSANDLEMNEDSPKFGRPKKQREAI